MNISKLFLSSTGNKTLKLPNKSAKLWSKSFYQNASPFVVELRLIILMILKDLNNSLYHLQEVLH